MTAARTIRALAIPAALLLAAACGCKSERTTSVYTPSPASTGGFPGDPVVATNLGADGKAFSDPGFSFMAVRRFDSGRGESVFLFEAYTDWPGGTALFASHFDGASFTRPVELRGRNQDAGHKANLNQAFVAFLFPGNSRAGDALIGFARQDADDGGGDATVDPNLRFYASYFDRSDRGVPEKAGDPSVRYGFETDCAPIDLTDDDYTGADVGLVGFVSDGTIGPTEFLKTGSGSCTVRQGNDTTFAAFFWAQAAAAGSPVRLHARRFDLDETANAGNQFGPAAAVGLDAGAGATDAVDTVAVNGSGGVLLFRRTDGVDSHLLAAVYDAAAPGFAANAYALSPAGAFVDFAWLPGTTGLFGAEAGLTRVVAVFRFTGGAVDGESSLYAAQIDPAAPSAAFSAANDRVELDAGTGSAGSPWSVNLARFSPVMNRTGEWIAIPWIQNRSATLATPALWVNVLTTPRAAAASPLASGASGAVRVDLATAAVNDFLVPADLRYRGFQSARNAFGLAWQQDEAAADTLRFATLTVTPGAPPSVAAGSITDVAFNDTTLALGTVTLLDGGGAGGTPGTSVLYYCRDARSTLPTSLRAYQFRPGAGETEIGTLTASTAGTYHFAEAIAVQAVPAPAQADVAGYPDWAGRWHHVFVTEFRFQDSMGSPALRHRVFDKDSTDASAAARFHPAADGATPPATIDTGLSLNVLWSTPFVAGENVAVAFQQADHLWTNEFDPGSRSWRTSPALVDDLWPEPVSVSGVLLPFRRDSADAISGAVLYWTKSFSPVVPPVQRLFVRAHR